MKRSLLVLTGATLAVVVMGNTTLSQDKDKKSDKPLFDPAAMAKYSEPGPQHKQLEPLVGSWTYKGKMWFDPSQPAMEFTGTCERKWVLGGRFVQETYQGDEKERPFAGLGFTGYDLTKKKFTTAFMDNMSTTIMTNTGTVDASGKVFTFSGEHFCPLTESTFKNRDVLTIDGPDKHHLEMYRLMPDGKEMKMFEMHLTRKK
jgi:hypothetical protein